MASVFSSFGTSEDYDYLAKLDEKIKKKPNNVELLIERGFLCHDPFENSDEALKSLEFALKLDPENVRALFWTAETHLHGTGDIYEARKTLEKCLQLTQDKAEVYVSLADIVYTIEEKEVGKAINFFKTAITLQPTWLYPRIRLVDLLNTKFHFRKAKRIVNEGLQNYKEFVLPDGYSRQQEYLELYITGKTRFIKKDLEKLLQEINKKQRDFWLFILAVSVIALLVIGFLYIVF